MEDSSRNVEIFLDQLQYRQRSKEPSWKRYFSGSGPKRYRNCPNLIHRKDLHLIRRHF